MTDVLNSEQAIAQVPENTSDLSTVNATRSALLDEETILGSRQIIQITNTNNNIEIDVALVEDFLEAVNSEVEQFGDLNFATEKIDYFTLDQEGEDLYKTEVSITKRNNDIVVALSPYESLNSEESVDDQEVILTFRKSPENDYEIELLKTVYRPLVPEDQARPNDLYELRDRGIITNEMILRLISVFSPPQTTNHTGDLSNTEI